MRIVIDKREHELFQKTNDTLLKSSENVIKRIELTEEVLPIGDILIQNNENETILIIERKTFPDLLASINDGRYEEQSHRLLHTSNLPSQSIIYLLEGMFSSLREPSQKRKIYSAMTSIQYFKGMSVMRTSSVYETSEWLVAMTDKIDRNMQEGRVPSVLQVAKMNQPSESTNYCNFVKKVKKENITPENIGEIVLSQIPGISQVTAIAIMKKFSTFPRLLSTLTEDPTCLDDIVTENNGKTRKIRQSCIDNIKTYFAH